MNMKTSPNDVSNKELLQEFLKVSKKADVLDASNHEILQELRKHTERFDKMDSRLDVLEVSNQEILEATNTYATIVDGRLGKLEREQTRISANMVTKEYLDDKLANQYSDIVRYTKKEIEKALN